MSKVGEFVKNNKTAVAAGLGAALTVAGSPIGVGILAATGVIEYKKYQKDKEKKNE